MEKMQWCLAFPDPADPSVMIKVLNSDSRTLWDAHTLLSDRLYNGHAFDGERVVPLAAFEEDADAV